jgi:uncharacterized protein YpmB
MVRIMGIVATFVVLLLLAGCRFGEPSAEGIGNPLSSRDALQLALKNSPLVTLEQTDITQSLPIQHVFIGRDADGKQLVVWVRQNVDRYAYLDTLISKSDALAASALQGIDVTKVRFAVLTSTGLPDHYIVWHIADQAKSIWVDGKTGEIVQPGSK